MWSYTPVPSEYSTSHKPPTSAASPRTFGMQRGDCQQAAKSDDCPKAELTSSEPLAGVEDRALGNSYPPKPWAGQIS